MVERNLVKPLGEVSCCIVSVIVVNHSAFAGDFIVSFVTVTQTVTAADDFFHLKKKRDILNAISSSNSLYCSNSIVVKHLFKKLTLFIFLFSFAYSPQTESTIEAKGDLNVFHMLLRILH